MGQGLLLGGHKESPLLHANARPVPRKNQYISGIEIDCHYKGINLHLLRYGFDEDSEDFLILEDRILSGERGASEERLRLTRQLGFDVQTSELNALSNIEDGTGIWTGEVFAEVILHKE